MRQTATPPAVFLHPATLLLSFLLIALLPATASAQASCLSAASGSWHDAATWTDCDGGIPSAADTASVEASHTVQVADSAEVAALTVEGTLTIEGPEPHALTVGGPLTLASGGTLQADGTAEEAYQLILQGELTNDGTLDANGQLNVRFEGAASRALQGTGTTNFHTLTLALGAREHQLDVEKEISMSTGGLLLESGTLRLASASEITPFSGNSAIAELAGFIVDHSEAVVSWGANGSLDMYGLLHMANGEMTVGGSNGNQLRIAGDEARFELSGGMLIIEGRYRQSGHSVATFTDGTTHVSTAGREGHSSEATFRVPSPSNFSMDGGTIRLHNANEGTGGDLLFSTASSRVDITGGRFILGSGENTEGSVRVEMDGYPLHHLEIDAGATTPILEEPLALTGDLEVTSGSLDASGQPVTFGAGDVQTISGETLVLAEVVVDGGTTLEVASELHADDFTLAGSGDQLILSGGQLTTTDPATSTPPRTHDVTGDAGWRMLSAPSADMTVGDLADQSLVQGLPDAHPGHDVNLYTGFDGTDWQAAAGLSEALSPGAGFLWYFFGEEVDETLEASGSLPSDPVVDLNGDGQFTLLGNPYGHPIDLEKLVGHTAPVPRVGQVWVDAEGTEEAGASGGVTGSYELTSAAMDDALPVWHGVFLENTLTSAEGAAATAVTIPNAAKAVPEEGGEEGEMLIASELPEAPQRRLVQLRLTGHDEASGRTTRDEAAVVYFTEGAVEGWDAWDASKLTPLSDAYATLAFRGERRGQAVLQAQASRPHTPTTSFDLPVDFTAQGVSGDFTITWPRIENIPENWTMTLRDRETGAEVDLRDATEYTFSFEGEEALADYARVRRSQTGAGPMPMQATADTPRFVLSFSGSGLPVELVALEARLDGAEGLLMWETAGETHNSGFEVEHRAPGAEAFEAIGFVEGAGTTTEAQAYRFRTPALAPGTHRFRLAQRDTDGTRHLSEAVELTVGLAEAYLLRPVYPNPFRREATVEFAVREAAPVTLALYNTLGQRVALLYEGTPAPGEITPVRLRADRLPSGLYFVRLQGPDFTAAESVVLVR